MGRVKQRRAGRTPNGQSRAAGARILRAIALLMLCLSLVSCTQGFEWAPTQVPEGDFGTSHPVLTEPTDDGTQEAIEQTGRVGSLRSHTGAYIDLVLDYRVGNRGDVRIVEVDLSLECYSISVGKRPQKNRVRLGEETFYFSTEAIELEENVKHSVPLYSCSFCVESDVDELPVYAEWAFSGVYGGKSIENIVIDEKIKF